MDFTQNMTKPNPRDKSNILSRLFFCYTFEMFKKGCKKDLDIDDLYSPTENDRSTILADRLEKSWIKAKNIDKPGNLLKVLIVTFWPEYLYLGINAALINLVIEFVKPLLLKKFLIYFIPNSNIKKTEAFWYAGAIVAVNGFNIFLTNQYYMNAYHYGLKIRTACCALIYRKALKLNNTVLNKISTGKLVNLLSNDVSRFDSASIHIHYLWIAPLSVIFVLYFLYSEAGYAGIVGTAPIFIIAPLQSYSGKLIANYRKETALNTDERVRLMDEIISGIQIIKMYAWEKPFTKLINVARKNELQIIRKSSYLRALYMTFNLFTSRIAFFSTLFTLVLTNQNLTADKVFVVMSYLHFLSIMLTVLFVRAIAELVEMLISIQRIQEFLNDRECLEKNNIVKLCKKSEIISLKNISSKWDELSIETVLNKVNLTIQKRHLVGIIGPVGSGKSALLQTILSELEVTSGNLEINGTISYASQEPWIFASTIRQNILFGEEFNSKRYNKVVHVCALERDINEFSEGDLTIIGERGTLLSGGQKARINLARAIYRDADIYLLDDPLSSVDIHVAKRLYNECINGFLSNKTRILVTHQIYHLKDADEIFVLNSVCISEFYSGVIEKQGMFQTILSDDRLISSKSKPSFQVNESENNENNTESVNMEHISLNNTFNSSQELLIVKETVNKLDVKELLEESSKGKVYGSLFWTYLLSGTNIYVVSFMIFLCLLAQIIGSFVDYFVSFWISVEEFKKHFNHSGNLTGNFSKNFYINQVPKLPMNIWLYVFTGLIILLIIISLIRSLLFYNIVMVNSEQLHNTLFRNIINFPLRFFNTNPSGRILNRFVKDIGSMDEYLPKVILDSIQYGLICIGALVLTVVVNYYFIIIIVINCCLFVGLKQIYLKSSKNIKRLEGITKSPVFAHLNATLQGLITIRAFNAQHILENEFDEHQNYHTSAWFMFIAASSAFGFYLDLLCFIFLAVATFSFPILDKDFDFKGGKVGLAITQIVSLTYSLQWALRLSADVSNLLLSVERIIEYSSLPKEEQSTTPKIPPPTWPNEGKIVFTDLSLKYDSDSTLILKDLNITINPREKIGIVGRTGAGKSSLTAALFRLANVIGKIEIDSIDTKDLVFQTLRSKISIIPQDPVLFSGTLRYNLDPFEEYPDHLLYKALNDVELKDPANIINRLENCVMDRGSNYSVGQKQLICLARALVRNNKILMLDEATSNIDPQTDALIQKTIREKFSDCTVLTVAHRLNTIMDSDKVLVMENGIMVEYDDPHLLLQNTKGKFYKMFMEYESSISEKFKKIAEDNYFKKKK